MDLDGFLCYHYRQVEIYFPLQVNIRCEHKRNLCKIRKETIKGKSFLCADFGREGLTLWQISHVVSIINSETGVE